MPETIPSLEPFEPMMTKRSGQEMLHKINQKEIIEKRKKVELRILCTALQVIARNVHTKFGVIRTYDDKVTLRTRKSGRCATDDAADQSNPYICRLVRRHKNETQHLIILDVPIFPALIRFIL